MAVAVQLRAGRKTTSRFLPVVAITLRVMGPRNAEETAALPCLPDDGFAPARFAPRPPPQPPDWGTTGEPSAHVDSTSDVGYSNPTASSFPAEARRLEHPAGGQARRAERKKCRVVSRRANPNTVELVAICFCIGSYGTYRHCCHSTAIAYSFAYRLGAGNGTHHRCFAERHGAKEVDTSSR